MRILFFSRGYTVHDQRFLQKLAQTEHRIMFLGLEASQNHLDLNSLPLGVQAVEWPVASPVRGKQKSGHSLAELKQILDQTKPDLLHAGPLHLAGYLAARSGFQPLVSMSWGYDLLYDAPRSVQARRAIAYTLEHSAAMVGDCATIRQLAQAYGMPDERIVTFPWGIDLNCFRPDPDLQNAQTTNQKSVDPQARFVLLSTRNWEPIYGVDVIARAFVQVAQDHPELCLVMLGSGSQAAMLRQIFEDGGVLDQVVFPGLVDQDNLPAIYQAADLYISASHSDGTSISLLEAMASGKPAIVSDIHGNREWITPGVQGWWFQDGDASALAQAIRVAIDQRSRLAEMGQAARQVAEQRADWDKNFPMLLNAYEIALRSL